MAEKHFVRRSVIIALFLSTIICLGVLAFGSWAFKNAASFRAATSDDVRQLAALAKTLTPSGGTVVIERSYYNRFGPRAQVTAEYTVHKREPRLSDYYDQRFEALGFSRCASGIKPFALFRAYKRGNVVATLTMFGEDSSTFNIQLVWGVPNPC